MAEDAKWLKLASRIPKATVERAKEAVVEAAPFAPGEYRVTSSSGKVYECGLLDTASGLLGYCTCTAFVTAAAKSKNKPVQPCKHLVWLKKFTKPEAYGMFEEVSEDGEAKAGNGGVVLVDEGTDSGTKVPDTTGNGQVGEVLEVDTGTGGDGRGPETDTTLEEEVVGAPWKAPTPEQAARTQLTVTAIYRKLLSPEDVVKREKREFIRRSGFRKIALAYGVTTQHLETKWLTMPDTVVAYARYRATLPDGRFADGEGYCAVDEPNVKRLSGGKTPHGGRYHVAGAIAATRAINRAISDLLCGGVVSAEEVDAGYWREE